MSYRKTITDMTGLDTTEVVGDDYTVFMNCQMVSAGGKYAWMEFDPEQARKLAKALKKAAKVVEVARGRVR